MNKLARANGTPLPQLLTAKAKEVAKALTRSPVYIRLLTRQGKLACCQSGRAVRYTSQQVQELIRRTATELMACPT